MASPVQNRIVGTVMIVALAVIFLPDLLDGNKQQRDEDFATIPLRPEIAPATEQADFPEDFAAQVERAQPTVQSYQADDEIVEQDDEAAEQNATTADNESADVVDDEPQVQPEVSTVNLPEADMDQGWVIRLGTFRNAENVRRLVNELQDQNFKAYSRLVQTNSGEMTMLLVGPDINADNLTAILPELQQITGLQGVVVRYRPTAN